MPSKNPIYTPENLPHIYDVINHIRTGQNNVPSWSMDGENHSVYPLTRNVFALITEEGKIPKKLELLSYPRADLSKILNELKIK
ncbi:hypothetical protein ISS08_00515 [Candidatus Pacearchaeota archaeon]|nr:hypothetical protein [Candidatus Pacearchaeota archaeon]